MRIQDRRFGPDFMRKYEVRALNFEERKHRGVWISDETQMEDHSTQWTVELPWIKNIRELVGCCSLFHWVAVNTIFVKSLASTLYSIPPHSSMLCKENICELVRVKSITFNKSSGRVQCGSSARAFVGLGIDYF